MKKIIGLGGCGTNVINYIVEKEHFCECERITLNDNTSVSHQSKADKALVLSHPIDPILVELLHDCTSLCVISGLGGNTSTKYLKALASMIPANVIDVHYIVVQPFRFEGKSKQDLSQSTLNELSHYTSQITVIDNESFLSDLGSAPYKIADIFDTANVQIIKHIAHGLKYELSKIV